MRPVNWQPMQANPFHLEQPPSRCKICTGSVVHLFGVDSNQTNLSPEPFEPSDIPVDYYQCKQCGFAWAPAFDNWGDQLFSQYIYNESIELVECKSNAEGRSNNVINMFAGWFKKSQKLRFLDYGCGPGTLVDKLNKAGFKADGYDRFYPGHNTPPQKLYDVVCCFEVLEHANNPQALVKDLVRYLRPNGIIIMGTFLTALPMQKDWWYLSPRGGHIAFYTVPALARLFQGQGFQLRSDNQVFHVAFRDSKNKLLKRIVSR